MSLTATLIAQSIVTAAAPNADALPGTAWNCSYNDAEGNAFYLEGDFPEAPKGWDPNTGLPTKIAGNGKELFLGNKEVNAFESREDIRTYAVSFLHGDGSRYNLIFDFVKDSHGLSTVTHYIPSADGRGKLHAYATGYCNSNFHALGKGKIIK